MNKKGFTLIELLTVIAILGILVLLAAPKFLGYTEQAKLTQIKNDSKAHETALNLEMTNNLDYINYMVQNWEPADYTELTEASYKGLLYDKTGKITLEKICEEHEDEEYDTRVDLNKRTILVSVSPMYIQTNVGTKNECFEIPANYVNTKLSGKFIANNEGEVIYIHNVNAGKSNPNNSNYNEQPLHSNPESDFEGEFFSKEFILEALEIEFANGNIDENSYNKMINETEDMFVIYEYIGTSTDVVIPEKIQGGAIKVILNYSFNNKGLTSIYIPNTVTDINANAFSNNSIERLILPSGLINIHSGAFSRNPLKTITFGNNIKFIDEYAFSYTELTEVSLPRSLKYIDETAFDMNSKLKKIYSHSNLDLDHKFNADVEVIYVK